MKKQTVFAAAGTAALAATLTLSLTACGGAAAPEEVTVESLVQDMAEIQNLDATIAMDFTLSAAGQSLSVESSIDAKVYNNSVYERLKTSALGEEQDMEIYLRNEDPVYTVYTNLTGSWVGAEVDATEYAKQLEQISTDVYLQNLDSLKITGTKTVDGKELTMVEGKIDFKDYPLPLDSLGTGLTDIDASLPYTMYIDAEKKQLVQVTMDMKDTLESVFSAAASDGDTVALSVEKASVDMTIHAVNDEVEPFEIPAEVLKTEVVKLEDTNS